MKLRVIDLFCGAGGLSAGFTLGDKKDFFDIILAIDNNKDACDTYNLNHKNKICISVNIEDWIKDNAIPIADIVIGGPPCQGFSTLNKNRDGDLRRALWSPYLDIVKSSNAKLFVMENVPRLLKSKEFDEIKEHASKIGFHLVYWVLNSADYGVPQLRRRAIIIGYNKNNFSISDIPEEPPIPTHRGPTSAPDLPVWKTVESAIADLLPPKSTAMNIAPPPYDLHFCRQPTVTSLKRYKLIPPGGNRFDLMRLAPDLTPACWLNKPAGGTDLFGRLWWDRPSVTIRTEFFKPEKGRYLHPDQDRAITHREAARLMTFPDNYIFVGGKSSVAKQIGNAVPVEFAKHIASYIYKISQSSIK